MTSGKDVGLTRGVTELLKDLVTIDGAKWMGFLYCYTSMVSDAVVRLVSGEERLCKYFDIPNQHASRPILDRMKRGGYRGIYERQIESIRKLMPEAGLRTSFIVGFPGETEDDFNELMSFVKNVQFDNVGGFLYSDEEGTPAFDLDRKVRRPAARLRRSRRRK